MEKGDKWLTMDTNQERGVGGGNKVRMLNGIDINVF